MGTRIGGGGARFPAGSELTDNPLWCILQGLSCKLDIEAWTAICSILSTIDHSRRPDVQDSDAFGSLHVILFGDS